MEILYKKIYGDDKFQYLTNDDTLNLTSSIIKIICEDIIKEVQIDDEIIKVLDESNEFIYNKIKTCNKKSIEIKIKTINSNKREKTYKKIIRIKENSFTYDRNELEMVDFLGKKAYENICYGVSDSEDYYETILYSLSNELEDIGKILESMVTIIKMAKEIAKTPKVDLIEKEIVRDSSEVKKITSQSARYFTMHPEYWYKEGENIPKPIKILTETFEENKDIYENQLIKFILFNCRQILKKNIKNLEIQISTLQGSIIKDKNSIAYEELIEGEKLKIESHISENEVLLGENKIYLLKFKNLIGQIDNLLREFKDIKLNLNLKIRMTQKILYDKRYYRILNTYKKYLSNLKYEVKNTIECTLPTIYNYMLINIEIICKSLSYLGFYNIEPITDIPYEELFINQDKVTVEGSHYRDEDNFKFLLELNSFNLRRPEIILSIIFGDKKEVIKFNINCDIEYDDKYINYTDIDNLYDLYMDDECNSTYILNTIPLIDMNFKDNTDKNKMIFKLSNLGNNFLTKEDYHKYGGYKCGIIPFSNKDIGNIYDKLIKLFRVKFIKLGFINYCTHCKSGQLEYITDELLQCNSCYKKVAINKCSYCGEEIIKFLSKDNYNSVENESTDIIEYHKNYELKSYNLGACYEKFYSNSGGFCSKCGKCQKADQHCIRCNLGNWEE